MREHTITKIRDLLESDESFQSSLRRAISSNNPQAIQMVYARYRNSPSSMLDDWEDLYAFNVRAGENPSMPEQARIIDSALRSGYAVVRQLTHPVLGSRLLIYRDSSDILKMAFGIPDQWLRAQSKIAVIPKNAIPRNYIRGVGRPNMLPDTFDNTFEDYVTMAKGDYLVEAEDELRRAWRMHSEDPRAFHRAIARVRGSKELVDKTDELAALNARAAQGFNRLQAIDFARDALKRGFAIVLSYINPFGYLHRSLERGDLCIITSPTQLWGSSSMSNEWFILTYRAVHQREKYKTKGAWFTAKINDAYDVLSTVTDIGVEVYTPEEIQRATPHLAVIPFSALPTSIKIQMGLM